MHQKTDAWRFRPLSPSTIALSIVLSNALHIAVACTFAAPPPDSPSMPPSEPPSKRQSSPLPPSSALIEYRELPIDLCIPLDRKAAQALDGGRVRLLLRLQNRSFARRYSPPFGVAVYADIARRQRRPEQLLSMQIDIASREDRSLPVAQTFPIDLTGLRLAARKPGPLCVSLRLDTDAEIAHLRPQDRVSAALLIESMPR
jgi:hypothetical protein